MAQGRRIAIYGAGYIGLVTGACFASLGHHVTVVDIQQERIDMLNAGRVPIYEPGLAELLRDHGDRLTFTVDGRTAAARAEVVYVCVDTPPTVSGDADLSRVWNVVRVLEGAERLQAVVTKSTVPVGTGARIRAALDGMGLVAVGYGSNPEFTAEGRAVGDFMNPDRVVVGAADDATARLIAEIHQGVNGPVVVMDVESAELTKLAANALLATKISFANEIANLAEAVGGDAASVLQAVGMDHRLGAHFLNPGLGYGGSCFPKDTTALKTLAGSAGYHFQLLAAVIEVNSLQQRRPVIRLKEALDGLSGRTVAVLGMTFKPGTDDMREAPSRVIVGRLLAEGATVRCWDPLAPDVSGAEPWSATTRHHSPIEALQGADAALVATEWPALQQVPWQEAAAAMARPLLFDGRNALDPAEMTAAGFTYLSVGRADLPPR
ncbi:UDPglucose 6-dehydrogenase [Actinocorallia herbida]|uniref:UDP-glucose 6-dehydrogenase n=1 Tax=Actinocorallia herbida TaxID=58109 RepID=A0A3N1D244_9ACTN|nr:UDP-glucose/GDP-mannose dehydrogenase family protein [Actinocorallia herbida]ROO87148.1 UDPglucose 6-dehydrogenase [Actinocorallia herbida]